MTQRKYPTTSTSKPKSTVSAEEMDRDGGQAALRALQAAAKDPAKRTYN
jgi:hypothetical protein